MKPRNAIASFLLTALAVALTSCGTKNAPVLATSTPAVPPSAQAPSPAQGLWVTFGVAGEQFKAVITQPASIDYVLNYLAGHEPKKVPNGKLLSSGDYNPGWSWHLAPDTIVFADQTIEVCDGLPTYVQEHQNDWILSVKNYCPWAAVILSMRDCRSGTCGPVVSGASDFPQTRADLW